MGTDTLNNAFEHVINNIESKEDFIDYLKEISVESEGNKTILYSGYSSSNDVDKTFMNSLRSDPNNRMIDKTDLGKFLSSITANEGDDYFTEGQKLQRKLIDLFGSKDELTNYLFSVPNGAWDSSSKRFIEEGSGKIDIFVKTTGNPEKEKGTGNFK